jgi:hypothetical protein
MTEIYTAQLGRAKKLLSKAELALEQLDPEGFRPEDVLKYMSESHKQIKESQEALLKIQDPNEAGADGGGDLFDIVQKMGLMQVTIVQNQQNNYGNTPRKVLPFDDD